MGIEDLLTPGTVLGSFRASSKKQTLMALAEHISAAHSLDSRIVFDALQAREKIGSTGVGHGVAIPHARIPNLEKIVGLFAHLKTPVEFESVDDQPVDLVFMLLAPEEAGAEHLKALAKVSRLLRDETMCDKIRRTTDSSALYAMIAQPSSNAA
ncbi:PTS IIA-like nitrogen-regulatory protein PtsN [Kordiimonas sediminis]|uniref:PTS IIA-like nitrogen-regulatory protein PtsN n=1 Tax=Kordiimonas sediminis TaxID=1735581 RepID=A0A919AN30_9PROT|nr:PTS IIA-like nitrogen regulatory protein PtsN [Kordiimonas sediminis]GHF15931.1 PTS IIA-like nitrogen-regulatory protein PtsN [Kordiimonas sediminis]